MKTEPTELAGCVADKCARRKECARYAKGDKGAVGWFTGEDGCAYFLPADEDAVDLDEADARARRPTST